MDLKETRKQIDAIDDTLMALLSQRFELSRRIGRLKRGSDLPLYDAQRESEILGKARAVPDGEAVASVYACILETSKDLQRE